MNILLIFLLSGTEDKNIVYIHDTAVVYKTMESTINIQLEGGRCISKAKGHYKVLKLAIVSSEGCLLTIGLLNVDAIVCIT